MFDTVCGLLKGLRIHSIEHLGGQAGLPMSPLLFSLYVDPLEEELLTEDATDEIDGDFLSLAGVPVPCLLFADDLVLLSSTRAGLQAMLGTLERFSWRTGLTVNRSKTKVVVFGAQLQKARQEGAFNVDGGAIETVGSYRYLGVEVSCSGRWTPAVQALSIAGLRATHALRQRCIEIELYDPGLRAELFDSLVRPILCTARRFGVLLGILVALLLRVRREIRLSRSTVAFSRVFLGLERARPGSRFWARLVDFRFLLIGSEPFHCIIIACFVCVIAVGWLVLLLRIVYVWRTRWSLCYIVRPCRRAACRPLNQ
jgi:hypothetical protein